MLIGKVLRSRYQIIDKLGRGGFGDTYLAKDIDLPGSPFCVVKHLKPKDTNPSVLPVAKQLFDREAEILYRLGKHEQIPTLYGHFEEDGEFYLVQEFVEGDDLSKELVPGRPWSEEQIVKYLQEILTVLAVVHGENVIHRDIKPSNIMRRKQDGRLVLIDFGAVKEINTLTVTNGGQTNLTVGIGSPGYMPSEQASGRPKLASDIYAVGMIAIQALTGLTPDQLQEDPQTGEIIWRNLAPGISNSLADVLSIMVRDHFRERYQNAWEALQALTSTVMSPTVMSSAPSPVPNTTSIAPSSAPTTEKASKPAKFLLWVLLSGLTVVGIGITAIVGINKLSSPPPSPVTNSNTETNPPSKPSPPVTNTNTETNPPPQFVSNAIWRSSSGKTIIPGLDGICWGNNSINSVQTVFANSSYEGTVTFNSPKTGGCVPNDTLYGNFDLYKNNSNCNGLLTVTWHKNNNAYLKWDITNLGAEPACSVTNKHWEINTYPLAQNN